MPDVAGVAIDPRPSGDGAPRGAGDLYVVLENGEVYGTSLDRVSWDRVTPVPNTPASENDED